MIDAHLVDQVVELGRLSMQFGEVPRITFHPDGRTRETDTTHTVMLALIAPALAGLAGVDPGLVAQFCIVHDFGAEVHAGDTGTLRQLTPAEQAAKKAREAASIARVDAAFRDTLPWLTDMIAAYERQDTPEARYVKAVDKAIVKITHLCNQGATVRAQGMTVDDVEARYAAQRLELLGYAGDFPIVLDLHAELVARELSMLRAAAHVFKGNPGAFPATCICGRTYSEHQIAAAADPSPQGTGSGDWQ
jgi:5'-deoxynucleotidase YfbR-like HD superfamily hydrolase